MKSSLKSIFIGGFSKASIPRSSPFFLRRAILRKAPSEPQRNSALNSVN